MKTRVPCIECGAEILPATAEATGGVCMVCKQGLRASVEASKEYYKQQRLYDPIRALWGSLVDRVHKTDDGLEGLNSSEKLYFVLGVLDGEVYNGGIHQFFSNSSGEYYQYAVDGLLEIKAFTTLRLLSRAKDLLFFDADPPTNRAERNELLREYPDNIEGCDWANELEAIDTAYYEDPDLLGEKLEAFARDQRLVEPFEKPDAEQAVPPKSDRAGG